MIFPLIAEVLHHMSSYYWFIYAYHMCVCVIIVIVVHVYNTHRFHHMSIFLAEWSYFTIYIYIMRKYCCYYYTAIWAWFPIPSGNQTWRAGKSSLYLVQGFSHLYKPQLGDVQLIPNKPLYQQINSILIQYYPRIPKWPILTNEQRYPPVI